METQGLSLRLEGLRRAELPKISRLSLLCFSPDLISLTGWPLLPSPRGFRLVSPPPAHTPPHGYDHVTPMPIAFNDSPFPIEVVPPVCQESPEGRGRPGWYMVGCPQGFSSSPSVPRGFGGLSLLLLSKGSQAQAQPPAQNWTC